MRFAYNLPVASSTYQRVFRTHSYVERVMQGLGLLKTSRKQKDEKQLENKLFDHCRRNLVWYIIAIFQTLLNAIDHVGILRPNKS